MVKWKLQNVSKFNFVIILYLLKSKRVGRSELSQPIKTKSTSLYTCKLVKLLFDTLLPF